MMSVRRVLVDLGGQEVRARGKERKVIFKERELKVIFKVAYNVRQPKIDLQPDRRAAGANSQI